ncbi:PAS domain-containing methyl-accepting chemotaxis protein [Undibacterium sp.]|uniref:methyl-accepting chemotaxis protein n=1 Tax=Undibacterium sp. TaxID=1914977 RepID=UPI00272F079D|nr:PAS domain-containing methyl-accepting chemotaxis protein [Undibacterium sp.]MDP1976293.1 methyl-accepting chemotaxis protein [Undibacterium sp.]
MPVTNKEYIMQDTETIVSKTDLQGNITYINDDFVRISGFSEEELLGAPQNIVRHPDMPVEAFADFWQTIKSGKSWTGLVKNRCKNGDHYWVEAHAAPLIKNGQMIGYTSIRVKPGREQVRAAEAAYRALKNGDKSLIIREGVAVKRSAFSWLNFYSKMTAANKLISFAGLILLLMLAITYAANTSSAQLVNVLAISVAVLSAAFSAHLYQELLLPLKRMSDDIQVMSSGDLSHPIKTQGSKEVVNLAQALKVLQTNVKLLVGQIRQTTTHLNNGASEISAGNADLSGRTESQASSLEETASSMEELTSTVKQNAENSREASQIVVTTAKTAEKGGHAVAKVVETMGAIKHSSSKISDIIGVIDGIAFQTNILALNAAVEAARAGEQGRGFAVVASEVRNLAQRSAGAAKEIKTLIHDSVEQVDIGDKLVAEAGKTMQEIVTGVQRAAEIMRDITMASQEQSSGIEQVNQAITQMDDMTQQNAALVEQAAASAESLKNQAVSLSELVDSFTLVRSSGHSPVARVVTTEMKTYKAARNSLSRQISQRLISNES